MSKSLPLDRPELAMEGRGPLDWDGVPLRASFFGGGLRFDIDCYSNPGTLGWFIN